MCFDWIIDNILRILSGNVGFIVACLAGYFCEYGVDRADPGGNGTCVGPGM
jgi:hypothetical protein